MQPARNTANPVFWECFLYLARYSVHFCLPRARHCRKSPAVCFACYRQARERAGILSFILIPTWMVSAYGRTGLIWSRLKAFTTGGFWMTSLQGQQLRVTRSCCGLSLEGEMLL